MEQVRRLRLHRPLLTPAMTLWLIFYFIVLPWIAFLCVLGRRAPVGDGRRTRVAVAYALSLALHAGLLLWATVVGLAFAVAWGAGRIAPGVTFVSGLFVTCLGHVGVLTSLARPVSSRWRIASVVALPAGWIVAAGIGIVMALRAPS